MKKLLHISLIPQLIVFFAGFTFLIFEISWNRLLSLYLGSTVFASTLVLATFMGGLGVGGVFWGRFVNKTTAPKNTLAILFAIIGITNLINYFLFSRGLEGLYETLSSSNYWLREVVVYGVSFTALIISTFFMGGILPVISKVIIRTDKEISHHMGHIYGLETLGSALGGLLTGFVFLGQFGQQATAFTGVGIMFLLTYPAFRFMALPKLPEEIQQKQNRTPNKKMNYQKPAAVLTFLCGLSVIALQIIWIRILKVYLTNTSYTFALIASLVIVGIFFGSWLYKKQATKKSIPPQRITQILMLMAALSIAGLVILLNLPEIMLIPLHDLFNTHFTRLLIIPAAVSIIVILPVSASSGYAFPFAIDLYTASVSQIGKNVGRIMLLNATGAFLGPLLAAFVLIPTIGAARSILIVAAILLAGIIFLRKTNLPVSKTQIIVSISTIVLLMLFIIGKLPMHILPPSFHAEKKEILYYSESIQGTLVVGEARNNRSSVKSTYVNNASVIGSSYDAIKAVKMVGHMPFFAGLQCDNALIVGFGIGVTTSAVAQHKQIQQIDCVELIPDLQEASRYYSGLNNNVLNDPRLTIHSGDGRHFLQATNKKYDFISSDPTHPVLGSGSLYTKSYFELYRKHLTPNGMVTQYLPLHKLNKNDLLGLIKTFHSVFPNSVVWLGHYHAILMGSMNTIEIDFNEWTKEIEVLGKDPYFYDNPYHLAASLIYDSQAIENFDTDIPINTDNLSYVEFFDFSVFKEENLPLNLAYLNFSRNGVWRVFKNVPDEMMLKRFIESNKIMTRGLEGMLRNDKRLLFNQLQKAIRINPENEELPFLMKLYSR
ncbi:MAG: fused MFS/spermidine synthase [Salinivirgaceae bacterium]|jgi:spermidine synthase|nr:fused MFS/spermidine synthase [Salinivirgaceae bacterium]